MQSKTILIVTYGSKYVDHLNHSLLTLQQAVETKYQNTAIFTAISSKRIYSMLSAKETASVSYLPEILEKIISLNIRNLIVLPTHLLSGHAYHEMNKIISYYLSSFDTVKVASPLMEIPRSYEKITNVITSLFPITSANDGVLLVGHGSNSEQNLHYLQLAKQLSCYHTHYLFITLEELQSPSKILLSLKQYNIQRIFLVPFLLVSGYHVASDMNSLEDNSLSTLLQQEGYEVISSEKGLLEYPLFCNLYVENLERYK